MTLDVQRWIDSLHEDDNGLVWTTKAELASVLARLTAGDRDRREARIAELETALRGFAWDDSTDDLGCYCSGSGARSSEHDAACAEVRALLAAPGQAGPPESGDRG